MKRLSPLALSTLAASLLLGGCAGLFPPGADEMAKLPVVRYGQPAPAGGEYVLHYPAGAPLPVVASVDGTLLEKAGRASFDVAVKRDVYVYRNWVSFDGKRWASGDDLVTGDFRVTLPGEADGKAPGALAARFDLRP